MSMTPEQLQAYRWEREIDERNRPLTDDELETLFPPGYKILQPPAGRSHFIPFLRILSMLFTTYYNFDCSVNRLHSTAYS